MIKTVGTPLPNYINFHTISQCCVVALTERVILKAKRQYFTVLLVSGFFFQIFLQRPSAHILFRIKFSYILGKLFKTKWLNYSQ